MCSLRSEKSKSKSSNTEGIRSHITLCDQGMSLRVSFPVYIFILIDSGKNEELLSKCKVLSEYMSFVNAVRKNYEEGMDAEVAVDRAVTECIQNGILADYLRGHRAEVIAMILTEFDEEAYRKGIYEEGHKEGLEQGLSQGRLDMLLSLVKDGSLTVENASAKLNVSVEEFEKLMSVK